MTYAATALRRIQALPQWVTFVVGGVGALVALVIVYMVMVWYHSGSPWRASDPLYVPFAVRSIVPSADGQYIVVGVTESGDAGNGPAEYVINTGSGRHKRLVSGERYVTASPVGHRFLMSTSEDGTAALAVLNGSSLGKVYKVGEYVFGWWDSQGTRFYFEAGWPQGHEAFNVLGILNLRDGEVARKQLHENTALLTTCRTNGHVYTEHWLPTQGGRAVEVADEYDADGNFLQTRGDANVVFSANCRYAVSMSAISPRGGRDWAIYNATSAQRLDSFVFGYENEGWFGGWNPKYDHLLLLHTMSARTGQQRVGVYDVQKREMTQAWRETPDSPPLIWSPSGDAVITMHDQHITYYPVQP